MRTLALHILGVAMLVALPCLAQAQTFTVLYAFQNPPDGTNPFAGLIRDAAGNFYGTAETGGANCCGTIFKLSKTSKETVLYNFGGSKDGQSPTSALVRDSQGNFYGTTLGGGAYGVGTVFKLSASGKETVLHHFTGHADGATPRAGLIRDAKGNLYGATESGGRSNWGIVFKLNAAGKETVLHSFAGGSKDGAIPAGTLLRDESGSLYGTTGSGGDTACNAPYGCGTVFRLDTDGKLTLLHVFTGTGGDGAFPYAGLIRDAARNFYGTAEQGGDLSCAGGAGCGIVFKLSKTGKETLLYAFKAGNDGAFPEAPLIRDGKGNLYGTTWGGGSTGYGTVFKIDSTGHETMLHSFNWQTDGGQPLAPLFRDNAGNLYGTTSLDGSTGCGGYGCGTVFKLTP